MKEELEYALTILQDAYSRLKESTEVAVDEPDRDGVIQKFEFTFGQI